MIVTVEGIITSTESVAKDNEIFTNILLLQKGEKKQVTVRLQGDQTQAYDEFEKQTFTGRLLSWNTRNGVEHMVMVGD